VARNFSLTGADLGPTARAVPESQYIDTFRIRQDLVDDPVAFLHHFPNLRIALFRNYSSGSRKCTDGDRTIN
jgi:hypothetical protein